MGVNEMGKIAVKDLVENFKKALIVDFDKKSIWVVKDGQLKVFPKKYFDNFIIKFELKEEDL